MKQRPLTKKQIAALNRLCCRLVLEGKRFASGGIFKAMKRVD